MIGRQEKRASEGDVKGDYGPSGSSFSPGGLIRQWIDAIQDRIGHGKTGTYDGGGKTQGTDGAIPGGEGITAGELTRVGTRPEGGFTESLGKTRKIPITTRITFETGVVLGIKP